MSQKVRLGVVGLGWPGIEHLKGLKACPGAEVTALCDLDPSLLAQVAGQYQIQRTYQDYKDLLAAQDVDAVSVCLPNFLHCPVTLDALAAGKHVICEKPPALNASEAQRMARAARQAHKVLMYALVMRFGEAAKLVKDYVDAGELGDIYLGRGGYVRRRGIPIGKGGWFVDKDRAGGGALIDIGVHALDCVWWLMGCPRPVSVFGSAYTKFGHTVPEGVKYDVDDAALGLIKFDNGATLYLEATWALNLENVAFRQIAGTKGGARLDPLTLFMDRDGVLLDVTPTVPKDDAFAGEVRHFVECIATGKQPIASADQGTVLMQMLDGIYESQRTGREVRLD